jgi:hypothetical protein
MRSSNTKSAEKGPFWTPRFSLRTLFVAMTLLCLLLGSVLAPITIELSRAAKVQQQVTDLRAEGYGLRISSLPDSTSLWLTRKYWPRRVEHLGQEVSRLHGGREVRDISKIPPIPSVGELAFGHGYVTCSEPDFTQPAIQSITYEFIGLNSPPESDVDLLMHYPNLETVRLWRVPANTPVVNDLAQCSRLRRLELLLEDVYVFNSKGRRVRQPFDTQPLRGLDRLEELQIIKLPVETDWSFLSDMKALREVEINPVGSYIIGDVNREPYRDNRPVKPSEQTPLHHLAELRQLRVVKLQSTPAYADDLAKLASHSSLEELALEFVPEGPAALASLRDAKNLRTLLLKMAQFEDIAALGQELQQLTQLRELVCEYKAFTKEHAEMLSSLKQLEVLRIAHCSTYAAGSEGRRILEGLPLEEFPPVGEIIGGKWIANPDAKHLSALASRNRQRRATADRD